MFVVHVIVIIIQMFFYCLGGYLSVLMRDCKNLMPGCLAAKRSVISFDPNIIMV